MRKAASILSATAIAIGTAIPAFAIDVPAPGEQSGSGATTLKLLTDTSEYGGTEIAEGQPGYNPASDPNDPTSPGVNLAFTVPSALNFVVKANGDLMCPSAAASYIQNESAYGIHVSSVKVDAETGWNIVSDASASEITAANAVSMNVGPATDSNEKINLASYASKTTLTNGLSKWGMSSKGAANDLDQLPLAFDGKAKNIAETLSSATDFATIHWYLSAGGEGAQYYGDVVSSWDVGAIPDTVFATLYDSGTLIVNGEGAMKDFDYNATPWFDSRASITSAAIEDGVTSIGARTFESCTNLISIDIPDGVTSVGNSAFGSCRKLTSIALPDSVTSIGNNSTFMYCSSLTSINIPNGVTSVDLQLFLGCTSLTSVTLPNSVTSIGRYAFSGCTSLTSINIPDGVTTISSNAFSNCSNMTSFALPDSVTTIGEQAFIYCKGLTSFTIPAGVTSIGQQAFQDCSNLTSVTLLGGVTSIGDYAFNQCSKLASINFPDGVTTIGQKAFINCTRLTSITLPSSVTSIRSDSFQGCYGLRTINAGFADGAVSNAPWGATNATITYNYGS